MIAPAMTADSLIVIVAALLIGSIGKAITGFGLPLIAIPVMAVFIGVETAVVVMVIPTGYSNVALLWKFRKTSGGVPGLWLGITIGLLTIGLGTWLLKVLDPALLRLILAGWIGVYLASRAVGFSVSQAAGARRALVAAAVGLGGICQGATGIAGPVVVTAMHAMRLDRDVLVFALSAIFFSYSIAQTASMTLFGLFTAERVVQGLIAIIPVAAGTWLGLWLGHRIGAKTFNACVLVLLTIMGLKLAHDGIAGLGGLWQAQPRLDGPADAGDPLKIWPAVAAVAPARNEAGFIGRSAASPAARDYPGALSIAMVDNVGNAGADRAAAALSAEMAVDSARRHRAGRGGVRTARAYHPAGGDGG